MIALLIANDDRLIGEITSAAKKASCETITYRWFLKALDNIVEINPDVILINTADYPRHWKSLCSFVNTLRSSSVITKIPALVLVTGPRFSPEDMEKAEILGVHGAFKVTEIKEIGQFIADLSGDAYEDDVPAQAPSASSSSASTSSAPDFAINMTPSEDDLAASSFQENTQTTDENVDEYQFIFTNPFTDVFVTGKVTNFDRNQITFIPDILTHTLQLSTGTKLDHCTYSVKGQARNIKAQVFSVSDTAPYEMELYLEG